MTLVVPSTLIHGTYDPLSLEIVGNSGYTINNKNTVPMLILQKERKRSLALSMDHGETTVAY